MGVLNNSKSSVVDCYNVATVSGGHSTYANGGVGGIAGQFGDGSIVNSYNYGNVTLGENLVAATKYVTLETLLKAAGADFTPGMTVSAADATGFASTLSYQDYQTCRWFVDGDGNKSDASAALALGHDFGQWTVEKATTCTENGLESRTCSRCQETETRTIQALGHTPELRDAKDAGCTQDGYTGDTYCSVCGQLLTRGQVIPAKGHDYQDGKCTVCGAEDPDYQPEQPTQPENPSVKTGDESYVVLWSAALLLGGVALVLLPRKKRS